MTKRSPSVIHLKKPEVQSAAPMKMLSTNLSIPGAVFLENYTFSCGHSAPIYEIYSVHALNQVIGYSKFLNRSYGDVYYRGECKLHDSMRPSLFRNCSNPSPTYTRLKKLIEKIASDDSMATALKIDPKDSYSAAYTIEGMLQHYGVPTRFMDVVDNHWISLWMGLHRIEKFKQINTYCRYKKREIPFADIAENKKCSAGDLYQYLLLIAVPGHMKRINNGIYMNDDFIEIDLRQALPSIFLRPHAQHGLVIRKRPQKEETTNDYDLSDHIIGILKMRIDRTEQWLGGGTLLTQDNLFPPPAYDHGYDKLLSRQDLFSDSEHSITQYI